jgi:hypothetical protein
MKNISLKVSCFMLSLLAFGVSVSAGTPANLKAGSGNEISTTPPCTITVTAKDSVSDSCFGEVIGVATSTPSGGTSPYTYLWSNTKTTKVITGLSAGTYTIEVTDHNGCTGSAFVAITQPLNALQVAAHGTVITCPGGFGDAASMARGGTPPYKYLWSNSKTTAALSGLTVGVYTVTVTDGHGCTASDTVIINQRAPLKDSLTWVDPKCFGEFNGSATATAVNGSAPYTYSWSNLKTTASISGLIAGNYIITITDSCGTTVTDTAKVRQPAQLKLTSDSTASTSGCIGTAGVNAIGGTFPYTYLWSPGGQTTATITGQCAGTYCCEVTDSNGCTASTCVIVTLSTGTQNVADSKGLNIYPNPGNGQYTIAGIQPGMYIELYDYTGKLITAIAAKKITMLLDVTDQPDGLYLIRLLTKDGTLVSQQKIVKLSQ